MTDKGQGDAVLRPGGARRLLAGGGKGMSDDERALLVALLEVDADSLDEEERAAVAKLKAQVKGYDTDALAQAVSHMVTAKAKKGRKLKWPELKRVLRRLAIKK